MKINTFSLKIFRFFFQIFEKVRIFSKKKNEKNSDFFSRSPKNIFYQSWKKIEHSFKSKNRDLFIYNVFGTFWALLPCVINPRGCATSRPCCGTLNKNNCYISRLYCVQWKVWETLVHRQGNASCVYLNCRNRSETASE